MARNRIVLNKLPKNPTKKQLRQYGATAYSLTQAEQRLRIIEMTVAGWTQDMISAAVGLSDIEVANIQRAELDRLERLSLETLDQERRLELSRCDEFIRSLWPKIERGEPRAVEVAIKVCERRSRLLGLDAPEKRQVDVDVTVANLTPPELLAEAERLGLSLLDVRSIPDSLPGETPEIIEAEICDPSSTPPVAPPADTSPDPTALAVNAPSTPTEPCSAPAVPIPITSLA